MTVRALVLWLSGFLFGVSAGIFARGLSAQEQPARTMRQWQLGYLPSVKDKATAWQEIPAVRVDVFDTDGVCLYVTRNYMATKDWHVSTVAVPKTQLPKGAGCQ